MEANCTQSFYNYLKHEKRYAEHTINAYRNDIEQFQAFITNEFDENDLIQVTHNFIRTFVMSMVQAEKKVATINRKISTLKSFYKCLRRLNLIQLDPTAKVKLLKKPKRLPTFIDQNTIQKIDEVEFNNCNEFEIARNHTMLDLLYCGGLRRAELIGLKLQDFDASSAQVKLTGKGNKQRIVPLPKQTVQQMNHYLSERAKLNPESDLFFVTNAGKSLYPSLVYRVVNQALQQISTIQQKSPHTLRHTYATHLANQGADLNAIKTLLGHSNLAATQVYTHNTIQQMTEIYQKSHPRGDT